MLNDKIALVTGATRGIGRAIALELGKQGATVIGTATSEEGAGKISDYLAEASVKGKGVALGVTDTTTTSTDTCFNGRFSYRWVFLSSSK